MSDDLPPVTEPDPDADRDPIVDNSEVFPDVAPVEVPYIPVENGPAADWEYPEPDVPGEV